MNRSWSYKLLLFSFSFFFFFFSFLLHHPTLFRWKRALRFASLGLALAPRFSHPRECGDPFFTFLPFTSRLLMWVCLKIEQLPWGSPTATPPFAPLDFAPKCMMNEILPDPLHQEARKRAWPSFCWWRCASTPAEPNAAAKSRGMIRFT